MVDINSFEGKEDTSITGADVRIQVAKNFSYSQLDTYEVCPRKYDIAYILKVPSETECGTFFWYYNSQHIKQFLFAS